MFCGMFLKNGIHDKGEGQDPLANYEYIVYACKN